MRPALGAKIGVAVITALLALYVVLVARQAYLMLVGGDPIVAVMGAALVVFPVLACVFIARELIWGVQTDRLLNRLADEGELPDDDLPKMPSGRPVREAADADFPRWKQEVEAAPDDWRARFRLGLAYGASGDKKRARAAFRRAIRLERDERRASSGAGRASASGA